MEPVIAARWCKESTKKLTSTPPVLPSERGLSKAHGYHVKESMTRVTSLVE